MEANIYESQKSLNEYLLFHYGSEEDIFGGLPGPRDALGFPARCVAALLDRSLLPRDAVALDIGCAVGRSTFELARHAVRVTGIDYSHQFIAAANILRLTGSLETQKLEEGTFQSPFVARVPPDISREAVSFLQHDAMNLPPDLAQADIVLAANLICRLRNPKKFLHRLPLLLRPGGQLLLTTPFTWMEEFTPGENWLGGREGTSSFEALSGELAGYFELQHTCNLPFVIREHRRKYQYGIALGSRWKRR